MVDTLSAQREALASEALRVRVQSLYLVKRSWALLESNPTRDSQARAGECSRAGLGRDMAAEAWSFPNIHLPCHASQNSPPPRRKDFPSRWSFLGDSPVPVMAASGLSSWPKASNHLLSASALRRARFRMRYALSGSRERKRPILATASRTLARAYARHASPSRHGPLEDSADDAPFSASVYISSQALRLSRHAYSGGVLS